MIGPFAIPQDDMKRFGVDFMTGQMPRGIAADAVAIAQAADALPLVAKLPGPIGPKLERFRRTLLTNWRTVAYRLVAPLAGGIVLIAMFAKTAVDSMDPAYGSGSQIGGVGMVFIHGMAVLVLGESFTLPMLAGTVLVLGGIALLARQKPQPLPDD